ncbi:hypothetical protein, partial [Microbacterium schleiferi]
LRLAELNHTVRIHVLIMTLTSDIKAPKAADVENSQESGSVGVFREWCRNSIEQKYDTETHSRPRQSMSSVGVRAGQSVVPVSDPRRYRAAT